MIWRSSSVACLIFLAGCVSKAEAPKPELPPPTVVREVGKAMLTTHGYIHPEDPPGTRRSSRPHHRYIAPCSSWKPGGPITDAHGKTTTGPLVVYVSMAVRDKPGQETVTASSMEAAFGPPHPAPRSVIIGAAAPLGPHWTWTNTVREGATLIAEARPDGRVRYHFAEIGRMSGGSTSASLMVDCLIEDLGTPGW